MIYGSAMVAGIESSGAIPKGYRFGFPLAVRFPDSVLSSDPLMPVSLPLLLKRRVIHRSKQNALPIVKQSPHRHPKKHQTQCKKRPLKRHEILQNRLHRFM